MENNKEMIRDEIAKLQKEIKNLELKMQCKKAFLNILIKELEKGE